jgi:hypothetical protein
VFDQQGPVLEALLGCNAVQCLAMGHGKLADELLGFALEAVDLRR